MSRPHFTEGEKVRLTDGDVVERVGGSLPMTVRSTTRRDGRVECDWFAGAHLHHGRYASSRLRRAEKAETA